MKIKMAEKQRKNKEKKLIKDALKKKKAEEKRLANIVEQKIKDE